MNGVIFIFDSCNGRPQPHGNGLVVDVTCFERERGEEHGARVLNFRRRVLDHLMNGFVHCQSFFGLFEFGVKEVERFCVAELPAEIHLNKKRLAVVALGQGAGEPCVQFAAPRFGDVINLHVEPFFALDDLFGDQALFFKLSKCAVNLALVGGPKMLHRSIEGFFEVVARKRQVREESEDSVFE